MSPANENEQQILGYSPGGDPQPFCWAAFWQMLICAESEQNRNQALRKILKFDHYANCEIITLEKDPEEATNFLANLVDDLNGRYSIISEAFGTGAANGYPSFYEPHLVRNGKEHILLIIKEPTNGNRTFIARIKKHYERFLDYVVEWVYELLLRTSMRMFRRTSVLLLVLV